jgi:hypothetical protein
MHQRSRTRLDSQCGPPNSDLQYIVFVAPGNEFEKMRPAYRRMLESFRLR